MSYPASFHNVIGVRGFILENEKSFWYNKDKNIQCLIDNNPYFYCDINNSYRMTQKCNSFAAAKFTGIVAKILNRNPDISLIELNNKLEFEATRNKWSYRDLAKSKRFPDFEENKYNINDNILRSVVNIVKEFLLKNNNEDYIFIHSLMDWHNGLKYEDCFKVIKRLEDLFKISFDYMSISRYDFNSIYSLTSLVKKNLSEEIFEHENIRNN